MSLLSLYTHTPAAAPVRAVNYTLYIIIIIVIRVLRLSLGHCDQVFFPLFTRPRTPIRTDSQTDEYTRTHFFVGKKRASSFSYGVERKNSFTTRPRPYGDKPLPGISYFGTTRRVEKSNAVYVIFFFTRLTRRNFENSHEHKSLCVRIAFF